MGKTKKSQMYQRCCALTQDATRYKAQYRTSTLQFWQQEHRRLICRIVDKSEAIKRVLHTLPVELYFKINTYLHLDDLKE